MAAGAPSAADLRYSVEFHGKRMMQSARLGLELAGQPALGPGMRLLTTNPESADESYSIPVGKTSAVREDEYQRRNVSGLHPDWVMGLPLLAEEPGLGWVAITEANIDKYAGMYVKDIHSMVSGDGNAIWIHPAAKP